MSKDDAARGDDAGLPDAAAALASAQQRALEQDVRIADLGRAIEHLRGERAELLEALRAARPRTGMRAILWESKQLLKAGVPSARGRAPSAAAPGFALASLPVAAGSDLPRWDAAIDILGDVRPALLADPPMELRWEVDVPAGSVLSGAVTLRPGAWLANRGGIDLMVDLRRPGGVIVSTFVLAVDPTGRATQRQWVPWRFPIPASGRHTLTICTKVAEGASLDYAWAVIADPRIEVPGLALRASHRPSPSAPGSPSAASVATRRFRKHGDQSRGSAGTGPAIALLLPVHDPEPGLLDRTLAAVAAQTSANWELCIVDDGSTDPYVRDRLSRACAEDSRVRMLRHDPAQGISGATNAALTLATAEFVATLDHDDVLAPEAIEAVSVYLGDYPGTDLVYSDNDILAGDRRFSASLKPDWSPDLLRAVMYTLHFSVYRRSIIEALGGWRSAFDGAQDHDLVLRLSERTDRIRHLPRVLYHWRAHAGSAALGELAKPLAYDRGRAAIAAHVERAGHRDATVERLPQAGRYRVRYPRVKPVTVLMPVRGDAGDDGLVQALRALLRVLRPSDAIRLVSIGTDAAGMAARAARDAIADSRLHHNAAVFHEGEGATPLGGLFVPATLDGGDRTAVFFERPAAPTSADAIDELAGHVEAGAAAVGGIIAGPDGHLVAGGVAFPQGLPIPLHPDAELDGDHEPHPSLTMVSNRLAVRGVVAVAAADVRPLMDAMAAVPSAGVTRRSTPRLAFVELTLAASERGGRVVWSPHARFEATQAAAAELRVVPLAEAVLLDRGAKPDPFWNPLRWADRGDETVPDAVHQNPLLDVVQP